MRCPGCGSDTTSALPRCTRCNAPLTPQPGDDATAADPHGEATTADPQYDSLFRDSRGDATTADRQDDATVRDPHEGGTVPESHGGGPTGGDPLGGGAAGAGVQGPPPWGGPVPPSWGASSQGPVQWDSPPGQPPPGPPPDEATTHLAPEPWGQSLGQGQAAPWQSSGPPPDHSMHMSPSDETTTHLSPEPWAEQPAIWQPPAPQKKSTLPYFLAAAGAVLLFGLAFGIVFWPSGSEEPTLPPGDVPSAQGESTAPATGEEPGDAEGQASAVNDLLDDMGRTRSDLGGAVVAGCQPGDLQRILDERTGQLERARELDVSALGNGTQMKEALVRALEASTESNQRYLDVAPGCPTEAEVADVNQRASSAKSEFLGYWAAVAEQTGLPARSEGDI